MKAPRNKVIKAYTHKWQLRPFFERRGKGRIVYYIHGALDSILGFMAEPKIAKQYSISWAKGGVDLVSKRRPAAPTAAPRSVPPADSRRQPVNQNH
jgi:hypothetical protein